MIELKIAQLKEAFQAKIDEKEHKNLLLEKKVEDLENEKALMKKDI